MAVPSWLATTKLALDNYTNGTSCSTYVGCPGQGGGMLKGHVYVGNICRYCGCMKDLPELNVNSENVNAYFKGGRRKRRTHRKRTVRKSRKAQRKHRRTAGRR